MSDLTKLTNAELAGRLARRAEPERGSMGNRYHPDEALLREAASRLQAPAVAEVEVKPLEWIESFTTDGRFRAHAPLVGVYVADKHPGSGTPGWVGPGPDEDWQAVETLEAAKAAAQADYAARIRSALRTGGSE